MATSFRPVKERGHQALKKRCTLDSCSAFDPSHRRLICQGCKNAAYCNKSCQKIDWPNHKPVCNFLRQQLSQNAEILTRTGLTGEEMSRILFQFKSYHFTAITTVVLSHVLHAGGVRSIPYGSQCMVFQLTYRTDCGGNPAIAFRIESAMLCPRAGLRKFAIDAIDAANGSLEVAKVRGQAEHSDFVDFLPVMYSFGLQMIMDPIALHDRSEFNPCGIKSPEFFLDKLRVLSERGHAYRNVGVGDTVMGQMKKRGNKWCWVALTDEEAEAGGYDKGSDFLGVYGDS